MSPCCKRLDKAKILGIRSGTEHRFTGVWVVGFSEPQRTVTTLELQPGGRADPQRE